MKSQHVGDKRTLRHVRTPLYNVHCTIKLYCPKIYRDSETEMERCCYNVRKDMKEKGVLTEGRSTRTENIENEDSTWEKTEEVVCDSRYILVISRH